MEIANVGPRTVAGALIAGAARVVERNPQLPGQAFEFGQDLVNRGYNWYLNNNSKRSQNYPTPREEPRGIPKRRKEPYRPRRNAGIPQKKNMPGIPGRLARQKRTKSRKTRKGRKRRKTKRRGSKKASYSKLGAITQYEQGGVLTGDKTVYLACGSIVNNIRVTMIRAVVHKLLVKAGIMINNWGNVTQQYYKFSLKLRSTTTGLENIETIVDTTQTWDQMVTSMDTQYRNYFGNGTKDVEEFTIISAILWNSDFPQGTVPPIQSDWDKQAEINLDGATISYSESCTINYQNQTQSDSTNQRDTVNANPILSKNFSGYGNWIDTSIKLEGVTKWVLDIFGVYQNTSGAGLPAHFQHDPLKRDFMNSKGFTGKQTYLPGTMWTKSIKRTKTVKFHDLFRTLGENNKVNNAPLSLSDNKVGIWLLSSFEKSMNTRLSEEQPIEIGYQSTHTTKMVLHSAKASHVPKVFSEEAQEA